MSYYRMALDNQSSAFIVNCQQYDQKKHVTFEIVETLKDKIAFVEVTSDIGNCIECSATITNDHLVSFLVDPFITWKSGTYKANVVIYDENKVNRLGYPTFEIVVNKSANPNADVNALNGINNVLDGFSNKIDDAIEQTKEATENAQQIYDKWANTDNTGLLQKITQLEATTKALQTKVQSIDTNVNGIRRIYHGTSDIPPKEWKNGDIYIQYKG